MLSHCSRACRRSPGRAGRRARRKRGRAAAMKPSRGHGDAAVLDLRVPNQPMFASTVSTRWARIVEPARSAGPSSRAGRASSSGASRSAFVSDIFVAPWPGRRAPRAAAGARRGEDELHLLRAGDSLGHVRYRRRALGCSRSAFFLRFAAKPILLRFAVFGLLSRCRTAVESEPRQHPPQLLSLVQCVYEVATAPWRLHCARARQYVAAKPDQPRQASHVRRPQT